MESTRKRTITRSREFLACTECRRRKLKCDRQKPCTSCTKRGDEISCTYQRVSDDLQDERQRRLQAEARLEHLERLVQQLAQHGASASSYGEATSQNDAGQDLNEERSGVDAQSSVPIEPVFNGLTHWSAMLEDIERLKSAIMPRQDFVAESDTPEYEQNVGASLILGSATPLPLGQVLAQFLPSRHEADRLTGAYFRSRGVSAPFIHAPSFQRKYQAFWEDPLRTPVLWTSILFSICYVAKNTLSLGRDTLLHDNRYHIASAHCLALGEYFWPKRYSVESLLLFAQAKCLTSLGIESPDLCFIFGVVIRLATKMGYHRDPDVMQISVFDREIRRRTWSLCMQLDLLISFHLGLPSNIQYPTWDTRPPRNLLDSDFDENTAELPPARPDSECTDISFYIAKHRLMTVFEKILRHTLSTGKSLFTNVDDLDAELRDTYATFPAVLRPRLLTQSVVDSPSLIVTRLCVFFVYQKCLCVLHRPYVTQGRVYSIRSCCDAASNIVRCFNDTYEAFLPGGQLETERWFMSSITWHDYLLGVMALCLTLCASSQSPSVTQQQHIEILELLQRAQEVCVDQSRRNKDSGRVKKVVDATILRFGNFRFSNDNNSVNNAILSANSAIDPLMQSSIADNHPGAQVIIPESHPEELLPEHRNTDWKGGENMTRPIDDDEWAYLEQFLNLSNDELSFAT